MCTIYIIMLMRQFPSSKILGQNPSFWQRCYAAQMDHYLNHFSGRVDCFMPKNRFSLSLAQLQWEHLELVMVGWAYQGISSAGVLNANPFYFLKFNDNP